MNSHFTPETSNHQPDENTHDSPADNHNSLRSDSSLEEETEAPAQPESNLENPKRGEEEVNRNSFVRGFVPEHNHGSVDYTSVEDNHVHQCLDVTSPPRYLNNGTHVHYTEGYTLFEDGHHHYYRAWSGPAIMVGNGMHVHYYDFYTTTNDGHRHRIKGVDMPAPGTV